MINFISQLLQLLLWGLHRFIPIFARLLHQYTKITVDAYKTAVPFYEKNGFDLLTKKESRSDTLPLYFDLASF